MFGSSNLLNKRLARSLWGTKLRLSAVIGMIFVGVFAGITFGGYSANLGPMYESIYEDTDSGSNLADIWIDNESSIWSADQVQSLCSELESSARGSSIPRPMRGQDRDERCDVPHD